MQRLSSTRPPPTGRSEAETLGPLGVLLVAVRLGVGEVLVGAGRLEVEVGEGVDGWDPVLEAGGVTRGGATVPPRLVQAETAAALPPTAAASPATRSTVRLVGPAMKGSVSGLSAACD